MAINCGFWFLFIYVETKLIPSREHREFFLKIMPAGRLDVPEESVASVKEETLPTRPAWVINLGRSPSLFWASTGLLCPLPHPQRLTLSITQLEIITRHVIWTEMSQLTTFCFAFKSMFSTTEKTLLEHPGRWQFPAICLLEERKAPFTDSTH